MFTVRDDGKGMDAETCGKILNGTGSKEERENSRQDKGKGNGIGVFNVNERIQLEYGDSYGVSYQSEPGKGTLATIRIPYIDKLENTSV